MKIEALPLLQTKKEFLYLCLFLTTLFIFNLMHDYYKYKNLIVDDIFETKAIILNIYKKSNYNILKLQTNDFIFYTKSNNIYLKQDLVRVLFISKYITFYQYLKGFFAKSLFITKLEKKSTFKTYLVSKIDKQHSNIYIKELFEAIFLAIPTSSDLREFFSKFAISHLIAISGFHLSLFCLFIYYIFFAFYTPIHKKFYNHRNKKFDLLFICVFFLFFYLVIIDFIPSFFRAFLMFVFGILFLRSNIKILSFNTLVFTLILIISIFPKYIFSLSLWFSIIGVFYVYLFLNYFKNLPKVVLLLFFNIWIFLAMNPVVHYFFSTTSYMQLFSFIITLGFTIFYPLLLFLHFLGFGGVFDDYLLKIFSLNINSYEVSVNFSFLVFYFLISLLSVYKKIFFIILNILIALFFLYTYI
ncbi:ComEC/Rec2 family competence protein [Arcobacter sp. CECT 8985]|uniref:ComEC/Rec2 family competence protein n=1 Tax=Arcobacter sp. CECT 8985 TaxID=1935424 RepID=UPI00100A8CFB|nr:ComEC/Rec2 family competence protein [Arcobacter sp. CECT 8985]RXJ86738.1 competence protein [Arcobacter sp. CECT 8985]